MSAAEVRRSAQGREPSPLIFWRGAYSRGVYYSLALEGPQSGEVFPGALGGVTGGSFATGCGDPCHGHSEHVTWRESSHPHEPQGARGGNSPDDDS